MSELKSCPFCGEQPQVVPWHGGGPQKRLVSCNNEACAVSPMVSGPTHEKAVAAWNRRAPDPLLARAVELLKEAREPDLVHCPVNSIKKWCAERAALLAAIKETR